MRNRYLRVLKCAFVIASSVAFLIVLPQCGGDSGNQYDEDGNRIYRFYDQPGEEIRESLDVSFLNLDYFSQDVDYWVSDCEEHWKYKIYVTENGTPIKGYIQYLHWRRVENTPDSVDLADPEHTLRVEGKITIEGDDTYSHFYDDVSDEKIKDGEYIVDEHRVILWKAVEDDQYSEAWLYHNGYIYAICINYAKNFPISSAEPYLEICHLFLQSDQNM